jgi:putative transposase
MMQIINWQTIYREPKTTMSNKNIRNTYLLKDLSSHKKSGVGNRYHLYSYGKGFMYLTAIIDLHTRFVLN